MSQSQPPLLMPQGWGFINGRDQISVHLEFIMEEMQREKNITNSHWKFSTESRMAGANPTLASKQI